MNTNTAANAIPEENRATQAANKYFARSGAQTLAVIEKSEDSATADVSVFARDGGHQLTVQLPVTDDDHLEYGADRLARRFGDRIEVIYADRELMSEQIS